MNNKQGSIRLHGILKDIFCGGLKKSAAAVLSLEMAFILLASGCTGSSVSGGTGESPQSAQVKSLLVYAAADGLYESDLTGAEPQKLYEGEAISHPVFSQDGTGFLFRQTLIQEPEENGTYPSALYAYDFGNGQTIKVLDNPVSYCAGADGTFLVSTEDGKLMRVSFGAPEGTPDSGQGNSAVTPKMEELQVWPEAVEKDPLVTIQYENLKPSPDFHYLAYDISVKDDRTDNRPRGFGPYHSGGLYVLDLEAGKATMVVEPVRATENTLGNSPKPGPWSPDGKTLWVWDGPQSASLTADGINGFFYHADTGERTAYDAMMLGYDESISYSDAGTAAMLTGGGREMFSGKEIDLITDYSGAKAESRELESISKKGLVPAMPQLSPDGNTLYFAGSDKNTQGAYPLKRQLYAVNDNTEKITQITTDPAYRNENPMLLADGSSLVFGRASADAYDGKMEIWIKDLDGGKETKLAAWTEPEGSALWMAERYDDYYGRGSWNGIFAIYDATK